jgi:hypothetical protein
MRLEFEFISPIALEFLDLRIAPTLGTFSIGNVLEADTPIGHHKFAAIVVMADVENYFIGRWWNLRGVLSSVESFNNRNIAVRNADNPNLQRRAVSEVSIVGLITPYNLDYARIAGGIEANELTVSG